jgi:integrase
LRLYLLPEWGSKTLADITRKDAKLLFARLRKTLSAGTLRKVQVVASSVFSEAIDNDIMTRNPCARHKLPAVQQTEMLTLTAAEVDALADAIDPRYRTLVYVAAYCGPRAGELWALRRQDVDLEGRQLHIRRALKRSYGQGNPTDADLFGTPKSGKARVVRLPRSLADMLAEHLKTVGRSPGALIFTAPSGGVMRHELFTRRFYKPALKAAVGNASIADAKLGLRFHDLRHTAGALAISNGASPQQVTDRLGHADPRTTARYSHLFEGHDTDLLDNLDTTLSKQPRRLRAVS